MIVREYKKRSDPFYGWEELMDFDYFFKKSKENEDYIYLYEFEYNKARELGLMQFFINKRAAFMFGKKVVIKGDDDGIYRNKFKSDNNEYPRFKNNIPRKLNQSVFDI